MNIPLSINNIGRSRQSIVLIMLGGIGNMVMMVPMLRTLREHYKNAVITLLIGERGAADILTGEGLVNDVVLYDTVQNRSWLQWLRTIMRTRKRKFDCAIVASNTHALKGSVLAWLLGAKHRVGENIDNKGWFYTIKVPFTYPTHEVDGSVAILKALGLTPDLQHPALNISAQEREFITHYLRGHGVSDDECLVGIHTGSGEKQKSFKRWSPERFVRVADEIQKRFGAKIVLTGGENERDLVAGIADAMLTKPINAAGQLSIRQTAALIQRCCLFVGNDSGLLHIAAAVKTSSIVIWGPTNHLVVSPRGEKVINVRKELPCSPCYDRGKVKCPEKHCLTAITVEDVMQAVEKVMNSLEEAKR